MVILWKVYLKFLCQYFILYLQFFFLQNPNMYAKRSRSCSSFIVRWLYFVRHTIWYVRQIWLIVYIYLVLPSRQRYCVSLYPRLRPGLWSLRSVLPSRQAHSSFPLTSEASIFCKGNESLVLTEVNISLIFLVLLPKQKHLPVWRAVQSAALVTWDTVSGQG